MMDMLQRKEFSELKRSCEDMIISKCWNGDYVTIQKLENEILKIASGPHEEAQVKDTTWYIQHQEACKEIVTKGIIATLCHVS